MDKLIFKQHRENYRWTNTGSRYNRMNVNVEFTKSVLEFKRNFVEDNAKVKIAPGISHTVYP